MNDLNHLVEDDELMREIRARKEEFAARFDFDIKKMGKHLREWEEKNRDRVTIRHPRHRPDDLLGR